MRLRPPIIIPMGVEVKMKSFAYLAECGLGGPNAVPKRRGQGIENCSGRRKTHTDRTEIGRPTLWNCGRGRQGVDVPQKKGPIIRQGLFQTDTQIDQESYFPL